MTFDPRSLASPSCPRPIDPEDVVTLAHGAGAGAWTGLYERTLRPRFANAALDAQHDGAVLDLATGRMALTTDTFVVRPLFFPGGDIGTLAVHGTLNDLAMCGAQPRALSCALVIEEGLAVSTLERVLDSMANAARAADVPIVTGDTKVVERGKGDALFVNTTGVGVIDAERDLRPARVAPGDAVLISGSLGCHGAAILSVREGLEFESELASDTAVLVPLVESLFASGAEIHCLRDPTRGGLGAVLHEIAATAGLEIELDEIVLPVDPAVRAACELFGLDPLFLACEGRLVAFVPEADSRRALDALRAHPLGHGAVQAGTVRAGSRRLLLRTRLGSRRLVPLPRGEPLPRIC